MRESDLPPMGEGIAEAMSGWTQEIAPYGIFTTDTELVIRSWNLWLQAHSGIPENEAVGKRLKELYPELGQPEVEERYRKALEGQISMLATALHGHLLPMPPPSREYDVPFMLQSARIAPLGLGQRVVGTITIIEDVTQRECQSRILARQQEHDRLLSFALETLLKTPRPVEVAGILFPRMAAPLRIEVFFQYLLSPDGRELKLHTAAGVTPEVRAALASTRYGENLCGLIAMRREPVIVSHMLSKHDPESSLERRLGLRSYAGFPLVIADQLLGVISFGSYERDFIEPDEIEFLAKVAQYVAISLDRTRREEELEKRVLERTAKLNESIEQLESFSYTVAHDLRAPIRSLIGFSEILAMDFAPKLPSGARDIVERLKRASQRLDALTRDLLTFSRLGGKTVKVELVDVGEVVRDILSVSPLLQDGVLTVPAPLGVVWAQRTLLQQCLSNLFDNALKFAATDVSARIVVRSERIGPHRRIWVEDNGIGIEPAAHDRIFHIFERIPGASEIEGTGIGLAIVAKATRQMGGTYGVESAPGAGARFWLEFHAGEAE